MIEPQIGEQKRSPLSHDENPSQPYQLSRKRNKLIRRTLATAVATLLSPFASPDHALHAQTEELPMEAPHAENFYTLHTSVPAADSLLRSAHESQNQTEDLSVSLRVTLGEEKRADRFTQQWAPDGRVTFVDINGTRRMWFSAGVDTRVAHLPNGSIEEATVLPQIVLEGTKKMSEKGYNGYEAITSVMRDPNGPDLIATTHREFWPDANKHFPFNAEVGFAHSKDGGMTWEKLDITIPANDRGFKPGEKGDRVFGAGQPSAIVRNIDGRNYMYVYYTDWNSRHSDAIHLARSPLDSFQDVNSWEKFSDGSFFPANSDRKSNPIISPQNDESYAALPSVSWNTYLNKYLATYETGSGFSLTVSKDGENWDVGENIFKAPQKAHERTRGADWYSYPTYVSFNKDSDTVTGKDGTLIFSKGKYNIQPHSFMIRSLSLTDMSLTNNKVYLPSVGK